MPNTVDLTYRPDTNGNMIAGKRGEYVANICQMMFNLRPGTDPYEPERGLYLASKQFQGYTENTRDHSYEEKIIAQFTTYTDLIPANVVAVFIDNAMKVFMTVRYENEIYKVDVIQNGKTLTAMLRNE